MSPAAQKFYNLLLAHYLNDNTVITKVKSYVTAKTRDLRKTKVVNVIKQSLISLDPELSSAVDNLSDEDWSIAIKTFDMRMSSRIMPAITKDGVTQIKLQPYQKEILGIW